PTERNPGQTRNRRMSETAGKTVRLSKVSRDFNLGVHTVVEFLAEKGHAVEASPNTKIPGELYSLLEKEFGQDKAEKEASKQVIQERQEREVVALASVPDPVETPVPEPPPAAPKAVPVPPEAKKAEAPVTEAPKPKTSEKKEAPKAKVPEPEAEKPAPRTESSDVYRASPQRVAGPKTV